VILKLIVTAAGIYFAIVALLAIFQRSFIYHPPRKPPETAALLAAGYRELEPGAWFAPPRAPRRKVIVFLHGNAGQVSDSLGKVAPLVADGFGMLLVEYPGFGGRAGSPSEAAIQVAARDAVERLRSQGVRDEDIVLWGESLGTGVATMIASTRRVGGVVLEAPFTSVADRAQEIYWWTPARWLVRDRFDNRARIAALHAPLLIAHGARDEVTPIAHGRALLAAAAEPKRSFFVEHAGHVDLVDFGLIVAIRSFLAEIEAR
jgi:pimeloyl-ACP methyl ester carboxylesterase